MKSALEIQFFLHFGYFPGYDSALKQDFSDISRGHYEGWKRRDLIGQAAALWRESILAQFRHGERHIVPLSGGLDSRAILAALMECTAASNIETYTFGTPGTCDFDLGCAVAKAAGTRHTPIRLDNFHWEEEDFVEAAFRFDHQTLLFHHAPMWVLDEFKDGIIWSGYLGDLVTGGCCPKEPHEDLRAAKLEYIQNRSAVKSMAMVENMEQLLPFIGGGYLSSDFLNFYEQIMYAEVDSFTALHILIRGFHYQTPFVNSPFANFCLSIPDKYRYGQNLFRAMLRQEWPELFSIPTKSHYGLPLSAVWPRVLARRARNRAWKIAREKTLWANWPPLPMTNYMDLDLILRKDSGLREIVRSHTDDLVARGLITADINEIWERHMKRKGNHADALKILFSLEINLKGFEKQAALGKVVGL